MNQALKFLAGRGNTDPLDTAAGCQIRTENLKPFSGWRKRAADLLNLRFERAIAAAGDCPTMRRDLRNGLYPGYENDVVLVCWLCSHDLDEVGYLFSGFSEGRVRREMAAWATAAGLDEPGEALDDAGTAAMKILFEVYNALNAGGDLDAGADEKKNGPRVA